MSFDVILWTFNLIFSAALLFHAASNRHYGFCIVFFASFLVSLAALASGGYGA